MDALHTTEMLARTKGKVLASREAIEILHRDRASDDFDDGITPRHAGASAALRGGRSIELLKERNIGAWCPASELNQLVLAAISWPQVGGQN
eukprot:SAG31_NODE_4357_length_3315_cov_2.653918_1_plen_92_part_00